MPRNNQNRRYRRPAAQAESAAKALDAKEKEYRAPTVGLEDKIFTVGTTADAAKFEMVKDELGKHFATQPWSDGANAAIAFKTLTEPLYLEPQEPDIPAKFVIGADDKSKEDPEYEVKLLRYKMQISKYGRDLDEWSKNVKNWKNNRSRMFAIVLQHCPADLVQRLKSKDLWSVTNLGKDVIALAKMIRDVAHAHDDTTQGTMAIVASDMTLYTTFMSKAEMPVAFCRTFQANVDTIDTHGGCAGRHPKFLKEHVARLMSERGLDDDSDTDKLKKVLSDAERSSCDKYLACLFILVADGGRYQGLKRALDNQYLMDKDAYPCSLPQAMKLLEQFKPEAFNEAAAGEPASDAGVAFAQTDGYVPTCFNCRAKGHTVNECPKLNAEGRDKFWADRKSARDAKQGVTHAAVADKASTPAPVPTPANNASTDFERFQRYLALVEATKDLDVGFAQVGNLIKRKVSFASVQDKPAKRFTLDPHKLYLDSCATYHSAFVRDMLNDVKTVGMVLQGNCNAGVSTSKEKGAYGLWSFWLNEKGIANLLSIPQLEKDGYTIDYNTKRNWVVTTPTGKCLLFKSDTGLCAGMPYLDIRENHEALVLIQTVRKNFGKFTERQVNRAIAARNMQARMAHPTDESFKQMVSGKTLDNCSIVASDVTNAQTIFGPNRPGLKGKTVRQRPERIEPEYLGIPRDFYCLHHFVTLTADVMFVNGLAFFTTLGRDIRFGTAEHVPSRTAKQLAKSLMKIVKLYALGGFAVRTVNSKR